MIVALLGAGSVALANACWIVKEGHDVRVWSAVDEERQALARSGSIAYDGIDSGSARVVVASDVQECITGADIVMIAAPAFAHEDLIAAAAPYVTDRQILIFHPVTGLSSMLMSSALAKRNVRPIIADLSTSLFTARRTSATSVNILKIKDSIDVATIPAREVDTAVSVLAAIYGSRFRAQSNVLAISLNNHNPVYHVGPFLCNLGRAERKENSVFWDWITPGVSRLVKLADEERLLVVDYHGTKRVSVDDYFREAHGATGADLDEIFPCMARKLEGPVGPHGFDHRFILEDVPYGLVFFWSLARSAGIAMPTTESLIQLTSAIWQRDFFAEGRTTERLGLSGLAPRDFTRFIEEGFA
jgi:opine dehydrogenase